MNRRYPLTLPTAAHCMKATATTTRQQNIERRNTQIKAEFQRRFTEQAKPRRYTREYIISQIAGERYLSMGTVENILYTKAVELPAQEPAPLAKAA
jgi:hypothetical protein